MSAFDKYSRGVQLGMGQGQNALLREQFLDKQGRRRQMQDIMSGAYTPGVEASPAVGLVQPAVEAQPASFDRGGAYNQLMAAGFIPEAMSIEQETKPIQWGITETGLAGDMRQKIAYNKADPTQTRVMGKPYKTRAATTVNVGTGKGFNKVDELFAKEYVDFKASGGFADVEKGLSQLNESLSALRTENVTGPIIGKTPKSILSVANPRAVQIQENVEEVVQRNLRLVLGAQFTEKEGERLIARAYNPNLDESVNIERVERLMAQIQKAAIAKQQAIEYYENNNGSLQGFTGKLYTKTDFENLFSDGKDEKKGAPQVALDYLKQNNSAAVRKQFKAKYGYLP